MGRPTAAQQRLFRHLAASSARHPGACQVVKLVTNPPPRISGCLTEESRQPREVNNSKIRFSDLLSSSRHARKRRVGVRGRPSMSVYWAARSGWLLSAARRSWSNADASKPRAGRTRPEVPPPAVLGACRPAIRGRGVKYPLTQSAGSERTRFCSGCRSLTSTGNLRPVGGGPPGADAGGELLTRRIGRDSG